MNWFFYVLIGGVAGWLVAWATDKAGAKMVKPIAVGAAGALVGGGAIHILIEVFEGLAPMIGAVLGAMALLSFVSKRGAPKLVAKK